MQKDTLTFHLTKTNRDKYTFDENDAFSQDFIHSLGLKVHSGCWGDIELDSPVIYDFIEEAECLISAGKAEFYGFCMLVQKLVEDDDTQIEWYQLDSESFLDWDRQKSGIETCKAYKMPPTVHVASGGNYHQYVSERFKSVVEQNGLRGLDFVWVKDTGKYKSSQWYIPVAQYPLGRGVDHPWFDPETLKGSGSWQPKGSKWRTGAWHFDTDQIKKNVEISNPLHSKILDLFRPYELTITSYRTFLRAHLPDSDFAYIWTEADPEKRSRRPRRRGLCVNKKAMDILRRQNLVTENVFEPVQILDELPAGCLLLDGAAELPEPYYSQEQLRAVRDQLSSAWQKHIAADKPVRTASIKEALRWLRKAEKERPDDFNKSAKKADFAGLSIFLPENWVRVLSISNGCYLDPECTLMPTDELMAFYVEKKELITSLFDEHPHDPTNIPIACSACGDWYSLEQEGADAEDAKVHRISHEDLSIEHSWDSIPLFICDVLSGFYDDE